MKQKSHYPSVNKFLKHWRAKAGLSQNYVGEKLGYKTGQLVSNWERGDQDAPLEALASLRKLYKFDEGELLRLLLKDTEKQFRKILRLKA